MSSEQQHFGVIWDADGGGTKAKIEGTPVVRITQWTVDVVRSAASGRRARIPRAQFAETPDLALLLEQKTLWRMIDDVRRLSQDLEARRLELVRLASELNAEDGNSPAPVSLKP